MRPPLLVLLLVATPLRAGEPDLPELPAVESADAALRPARDLRTVVDVAWTESTRRDGTGTTSNQQVFARLRYDGRPANGWRVVVDDLLALQPRRDDAQSRAVNTIIDAYASWQPRPEWIADLGRVNARFGVAAGFNPTDYLREHAVRSIISIDPATLRANRLGTVMLRAQALSTAVSWTAIYAPKLDSERGSAPFALDLGATNARERWLLAASHRPLGDLDVQWLLTGGGGRRPQLGVNATTLLNARTVAYVEWSGGQGPSLASSVLEPTPEQAFRSQLATGVTYTTAANVSLTFEFEYNGSGLTRDSARELEQIGAGAYTAVRAQAFELQVPPTRRRLFSDLRWKDAFVNRLDLGALAYYDIVDHSRQFWVEARYRGRHFDSAVQWLGNAGVRDSDFGALPVRQSWRAFLTFYF